MKLEEQRPLVSSKFLRPIFVASLVRKTNVELLFVPIHQKHPQDKIWHGRKIHSAAPWAKLVQ